ncbi:hypothetical protein [Streptomyces virginiae]
MTNSTRETTQPPGAGAGAGGGGGAGQEQERPELQKTIEELVASGFTGIQLRVHDERGEWVGTAGVAAPLPGASGRSSASPTPAAAPGPVSAAGVSGRCQAVAW